MVSPKSRTKNCSWRFDRTLNLGLQARNGNVSSIRWCWDNICMFLSRNLKLINVYIFLKYWYGNSGSKDFHWRNSQISQVSEWQNCQKWVKKYVVSYFIMKLKWNMFLLSGLKLLVFEILKFWKGRFGKSWFSIEAKLQIIGMPNAGVAKN